MRRLQRRRSESRDLFLLFLAFGLPSAQRHCCEWARVLRRWPFLLCHAVRRSRSYGVGVDGSSTQALGLWRRKCREICALTHGRVRARGLPAQVQTCGAFLHSGSRLPSLWIAPTEIEFWGCWPAVGFYGISVGECSAGCQKRWLPPPGFTACGASADSRSPYARWTRVLAPPS